MVCDALGMAYTRLVEKLRRRADSHAQKRASHAVAMYEPDSMCALAHTRTEKSFPNADCKLIDQCFVGVMHDVTGDLLLNECP